MDSCDFGVRRSCKIVADTGQLLLRGKRDLNDITYNLGCNFAHLLRLYAVLFLITVVCSAAQTL